VQQDLFSGNAIGAYCLALPKFMIPPLFLAFVVFILLTTTKSSLSNQQSKKRYQLPSAEMLILCFKECCKAKSSTFVSPKGFRLNLK